MTASGKSLKDIYDAGTEKLLDLEKQCGAQLKDSAQDLSQSRQNNEQGATQRVETRTLELEQELRSFMAASVERLQKVLDAENQGDRRSSQKREIGPFHSVGALERFYCRTAQNIRRERGHSLRQLG